VHLESVHWHVGPLTDPEFLEHLIADTHPDEIYNLASVSHPAESWKLPFDTTLLNALVPQQIFEFVLKHEPACRVYQATSSEIFGNAEFSAQNESTPYNPQSPYGISKLCAHLMAGAYRHNHGLHISSGIMFNHGSPRRPLSFVSQKIAHAAAAVAVGLSETKEQDEFEIGTGESHSIREFCEIPFRRAGRDRRDHVVVDPELVRKVDTYHTAADSSKAAARLGWRLKTSFAELVALIVDNCQVHTWRETDLR
jgi:GDPmannose 4,6-dehydratase